ncbi:MAG: ribosome maturation factor RimP [Eubacterium sp.]|nr:ribosome maturation factor RimP [Eubacterium sp.]
MSKAKSYEEKTETLIAPIVEEHGFELVDVEYVKEGSDYFLRVYIDKEGGITIDDCVLVSRQFNEILDREDYINDVYTFEVSSPGVDRVLKKDKDLNRSIGKRILIKTYNKIEDKKEFYGKLVSFDADTIGFTDENTNEDKSFARKDISLIRLAFDFDNEK